MRKIYILGLIGALLLGMGDVTRAEISIDQLVEQARITEGEVAVSELPRWAGAHKILVWDIGMDLSGLTDALPDVEFVVVSSADEAMQHASDDRLLFSGTCWRCREVSVGTNILGRSRALSFRS